VRPRRERRRRLRPPAPWYLALVAVVGAQRLRELRLSAAHERETPGRRAAARSYPLMVVAHVGLLTLPVAEAALRGRRSRVPLAWVGLLAGATALRWWSIRSLGRSWNVRAVVPDDLVPVTTGPYRYVRHPNYLAVALEFLALPMAAGAVWSAVGLSLLDAVVLFDRIRSEERLLSAAPGYEAAFRKRARLVPGVF
jgi:methyltransferase